MTKLSTRKEQIEELEGFSIEIFDADGDPADLDQHGLPAYPFARQAPGSTTVAAWKKRIHQNYPGYTCDVLHEDGSVAHGLTLLKNVRKD